MVDLPQPEGPMRLTNSDWRTSRLTLDRAWTSRSLRLNHFDTASKLTAGAVTTCTSHRSR